jgi:hypothetical protein
MTSYINLKISLILATVLMLPVAHAAAIGKADYKAGRTRISEEYKRERVACDSQAGNEKDVCVKEAKTSGATTLVDTTSGKKKQKVSKVPNQHKHVADHKVASEKCYLLAGDAKDSCITAAKIKYGIE